MKNKLKKIFITGGAGFIGSHVSEAFFKNFTKSKIIILDKLTYAGNKSFISSILKSKRVKFIKSDINDTKKYTNFLNNCDLAINIAAESHVDNSITNSNPFISTNINGTINLLNASLKVEVDKFHHISTDEVYGSLDYDDTSLFREDTPYDPRNPYSATKASAEHFVTSWHNTYGLPHVITGCSNNYCKGQHFEKLIPMVIMNAMNHLVTYMYDYG